MPSTIPRASMNDEQWVSTFGTANNIGQEVEGEFKQTQEGNTDQEHDGTWCMRRS